MRTIKLKLLTQRETVSVETCAVTFGELKKDLIDAGVSIDFSNAQFIERVTKAEYGKIDSALIPVGDEVLFYVVPVKTKLGAEVDDMSYTEVRNYVGVLNRTKGAKISILGSKDTLVSKVKAFLATQEAPVASPVEKIKELAEAILDQVAQLRDYAAARNDVVYQVTLDDLETEITELKKQLS